MQKPHVMSGLLPTLTTDPADIAQVADLLTLCGLPIAGLEDVTECFILRRDDKVVACAALEIRGKSGLLRSVAVHPDLRREKLGQALVVMALLMARTHRATHLYLLTETAVGFFLKAGFTIIDRAGVDPAIQKTVEFTSACPASATVMVMDLVKLAQKR